MVFIFEREKWCVRIASITIFASIIFLVSFLVGADFLNQPVLGVPGVRFVTVIALLVSGNILLNIVHYHQPRRWEFARVYLALLVMVLILIIVPLWATLLLGIPSGYEHLLQWNATDVTAQPLAPVGGLVIFTSVAIAGFAAFIHRGAAHDFIKWSGAIIAAVGVVAVVGHVLHQPSLYFETARSLSMSLVSAILAIILGIGLFWSGGISESETHGDKPVPIVPVAIDPENNSHATNSSKSKRKKHARKV